MVGGLVTRSRLRARRLSMFETRFQRRTAVYMGLVHDKFIQVECSLAGVAGKFGKRVPAQLSKLDCLCEDKSLLTNELLVHMSPDFSEPGNQSQIQEIIANEFSSDELTAIVDSPECSNDSSPDCSTNILNCNYMQIGSALDVMSPIDQ
ncbi:hypothetical protein AVEN_238371-1 [Araneus ventricosus]|uniref:Uncharacterized protein n=1 Tax=Araneus ventricosus TaxID=182803 RepID=A0A4Y2K8B9_ARAVE|nr:hypothetical protein AVEN_238371-1 [Araneus ventricosus]